MYKKEVSFLSDLNLNKIQILGDRFSLDDIRKSKIHPALIHFINANIDKKILDDRQHIIQKSLFDYSGDRINNYFSLISDEIKRTHIFELPQIKQLVSDAINFNISFLVSPNKTLLNFIFNGSEKKSAEVVVNGISHAYYYKYVQKILFTYLDKKKIVSISKGEFGKLLERIDVVSKETHLEDTITTAVNSMANFLTPQSRSAEEIPIQAIKQYLEEKNLYEFIEKLNAKYGNEFVGHGTTTEITNILLSVTPAGEMSIEEKPKFEDELVEESSNIAETDSSIVNEEILQPSDDVEIPNDELLSNDETINEDKITSDTNNFREKNTAHIVKDDLIDESNEELSNHNPSQDHEDELKKKPSSNEALDNLIDLNQSYDYLNPEPKPFADINEKQLLDDLGTNITDDLHYQVDTINLKEELNLPDAVDKKNGSSNIVDKESLENNAETTNKSLLIDENLSDQGYEEIIDKHEIDLSKSIDEVVKNNIVEKEFIEEANDSADINKDDDEVQDLENVLSDEKLVLLDEQDDEITEVFKDLSFLDNEETEMETSTELNENIREENNITIKEETIEVATEEETYSSFAELTSTKDMARIIESIFDYDMEDYHAIIDKISGATTEDEALQILNEYWQTNHFEQNSKETEEFKSYISQYFSKVLS